MALKSTIMQLLEVKPNKNRISFGYLADLKRTMDNSRGVNPSDDQLFYREFYKGNYALSIIVDESLEKSKPVVIFHHENVDPQLLLHKLEDIERNSASVETDQRWPTTFFDRGNKFDWFTDYGKTIQQVIYTDVYKMHGNDGEEKARCSSNLIYFVSDLGWTLSIASMETFMESSVYKLESDGNPVGIAFNPAEIMGRGAKRVETFQDPDGGCFALVMQNEWGHADVLYPTLLCPVTSFLFENEYRCFFNDGQASENAFYGGGGGNDSSQFGFSRLPSNVFVKILLHLPWNQQVLVRRVSKDWLKAANSALVVSTKSIDVDYPAYQKMRPADLNNLIPIVADGLETLDLDALRDFQPPIDWCIDASIQSFRRLRELYFEQPDLTSDQFFTLLDKCPNLKVLMAAVPVKLSNGELVPRYSTVEELISIPGSGDFNDPHLMAIADHFPNLAQISMFNYGYVTGSGASAFVQRYGDKLTELELYFGNNLPPVSMGVFNGISVCQNLTHLALIESSLVSNTFMSALSNGCKMLETLDLCMSTIVTNEGLAYLAELPNLKKLNITDCATGLDAGVTAIVMEGHLEQLIACDVNLAAETVKTCIRKCRGLLVLDISGDEYSLDEAEEVATLWGQYGRVPTLIIQTRNPIWRSGHISEIQVAILNGDHSHRGQLVID